MAIAELKAGCYRGMIEVKYVKNGRLNRLLCRDKYSREVSIHYNDQPLSERESQELYDSLEIDK